MKNKHNTFFALARNEGTLNIYLYDDIEGDSTDLWTGDLIESTTSAGTIAKQIEAAGEVAEINVYINSYGGDVKEGLGIYSQLMRSNANVTAYIDGFACSIASVIAMAAHKVVMNPSSLMMIHKAWMVAVGNSAELRKSADDLDVIDIAIKEAYLNKVGEKMDEATLTELLEAETWLPASRCLELGLCDEVKTEDISEEEKALNEAIEEAKEEEASNALREALKAMFSTNQE